MSVERSNVKVIQECLSLLERSLEQRLTDGENFNVVSIKNSGSRSDFLLITVDIFKGGTSLDFVNFCIDVENETVYSESEWKSRWKDTNSAKT